MAHLGGRMDVKTAVYQLLPFFFFYILMFKIVFSLCPLQEIIEIIERYIGEKSWNIRKE